MVGVHSGQEASVLGGDEAGGAHTPGPWEVIRINERGQQTPDGDSWWVYAGNGNGWVGDSYMSACLGSEHGAEANARLIAASPTMLTALREARDALHQHYVDWDGEPEDAVALQLARAKCDAAIALATQPAKSQQEGEGA